MQGLWNVFHEVKNLKLRKVTDLGSWKKVQMGSEGWKCPKNEVVRVLAKILSTKMYMFFYFNTEVSMFFNFLQKHVWENTSGSWVTVQKPQAQSECRIL